MDKDNNAFDIPTGYGAPSGWVRGTLRSLQAELAISLITRWGAASAKPDGEDSAGRQKLRNLTPQELVDHACETAARAVAAFHQRGWLRDTQEVLDGFEAATSARRAEAAMVRQAIKEVATEPAKK